MEEKDQLDFDELDGQLGLVIQHLEKKDKKKAVSYYLKESTIERIKAYAQKYNMKDSQFLEEVVNKLIDVIEGQRKEQPMGQQDEGKDETIPIQSSLLENTTQIENNELTQTSPSESATPWGRLQTAKTAKQISEEVNRNHATHESRQELREDNKMTGQADIKEKQEVAVTLNEAQLKNLEEQVIDYIFNTFKPDYRILYRRFEDKVRQSIQIEKEVLFTITKRLDKNGDVTFFEKQNLLDINKKIFEERLPNRQDLARLYEDADVID